MSEGYASALANHEREKRILLKLHFGNRREHPTRKIAGARAALARGWVIDAHLLTAFGKLKGGYQPNNSTAHHGNSLCHDYDCNSGFSTKARAMATPATLFADARAVLGPNIADGDHRNLRELGKFTQPSIPSGGRFEALVGEGRNGPAPM